MTRFLFPRPARNKSTNPLNTDLLSVKLLASVLICEAISQSNYNSTYLKKVSFFFFIAIAAMVASMMGEEQRTTQKVAIMS